jgi:hypothetical protein
MKIIITCLFAMIAGVAFAQRDLGLEPTIKPYPTPPLQKSVEPIQVFPQVCIQGAPTDVNHCRNPRVDCTPCHGGQKQNNKK